MYGDTETVNYVKSEIENIKTGSTKVNSEMKSKILYVIGSLGKRGSTDSPNLYFRNINSEVLFGLSFVLKNCK